MTPKSWAKYAWVFHVCTMAFVAGLTWSIVPALAARMEKLESNYQNVPSALARIEQKVDDLHDSYFRTPIR